MLMSLGMIKHMAFVASLSVMQCKQITWHRIRKQLTVYCRHNFEKRVKETLLLLTFLTKPTNALLPWQVPWLRRERKKMKKPFWVFGVWTVWSLRVIMGRKKREKLLELKPSELAIVNWLSLDSSRFYTLPCGSTFPYPISCSYF